MKRKDFRIAEYDGVFTIKRKQITTETRLFRKDIITTRWRNVNIYGGVYHPLAFSTEQSDFDSKSAAIKKIKIMLKGIIYHKI